MFLENLKIQNTYSVKASIEEGQVNNDKKRTKRQIMIHITAYRKLD